MENINFQSLIQVKFDLTVFQNNLANALKVLNQKINKCTHQNSQLELKINDKFNHSDQQIQQINSRVDNWQEKWSSKFQTLEKSSSTIKDNGLQNSSNKKARPFNKLKKGIQKAMKQETNKESPDLKIKKRDTLDDQQYDQNLTNSKKLTFKSKSNQCEFSSQHEEIIEACEQMMNNWVKQVSSQINKIKMKFVINQFGKKQISNKSTIKEQNDVKELNYRKQTLKKVQFPEGVNQYQESQQQGQKNSQNQFQSENKFMDALVGDNNIDNAQNLQFKGYENNNGFNLSLYLNKLKSDIFRELRQSVDQQKGKIDDNSKNISLMADHIVSIKSKVEESQAKNLLKDGELQKLQEQFSALESQILLLKQAAKVMKNDMSTLSTKLLKQDQIIDETLSEARKENVNSHKSFREEQAQSASSRRSTLISNKRQSLVNRNSILGGISLDSYEDMIKKLNAKVIVLTQRLNKMEDDKKFRDSKSGFLPKLQKQGKANNNSAVSIDLIKSDIKKLNDDLLKTNQKLFNTKTRLNQLYESHAEIPAKIADLYQKLTEKHELEEDRLIELIKQLINRCLADPFNNNFTNTLKREINVKFLEIKHQYYGILKEIENKVEDRAQQKQLIKLRQQLEENILQVKTLLFKKCETQDFKKGIKYLQKKLQQLQAVIKADTANLQKNNGNNYIVNKKH